MNAINQVWFLSIGMFNTVWLTHLLMTRYLQKCIINLSRLDLIKVEIHTVLCSGITPHKRVRPHLPWTCETQTQQHESFFFFSWPEMMRNAGAQQSCRYSTPLLSKAGENPIHFQLLYLLTVDHVSKHKGKASSPIHTLPVFIKHWISITSVALVQGGVRGKKWHKTTFKS